MIPNNLIINADDFGIDPRVSKGIAHCVENGLINSFSVLPFLDTFHDTLLKSLISRFPNIRVGSHLTFIQTHHQSDGSQVQEGLREHSNHYRDFLKLYLLGRYPPSRIYTEWKSQILFIGKYLGGPEKIAHLDSHQHFHVLPGIWPVAVALQKEFGIPRLRVPYESLSRSVFYKFPFGFALQVLAALRKIEPGLHASKTDRRRLIGFFSSTHFTLEANLRGLRMVKENPQRHYELMVHPAVPCELERSESFDLTLSKVSVGQAREVEELGRVLEFFRFQSNKKDP